MSDLIKEDLKSIIKDRNSLSRFIKMNDIKEMYNFCINSDKSKKGPLYTEQEFYNKVDELISSIPKYLFDDNEW